MVQTLVEGLPARGIAVHHVNLGLSRVQEDGKAHEQVMGLVEKELILQVLRSFQGTQTKTASKLGINRNTLHKKIDDYGLQGEAR